RFLIIDVARGASGENLVRVIDLGDPLAPALDAPVIPIVDEWGAQYIVLGNDGATLFVLTNKDAPRKRIVAIDVKAPAPANWKTLVPESTDVIDSVAIIGGRFVV